MNTFEQIIKTNCYQSKKDSKIEDKDYLFMLRQDKRHLQEGMILLLLDAENLEKSSFQKYSIR